jgi:ribosomal-protein-alanine N-acetyltransferase
MAEKPLAAIREFRREDINKILEIEQQAFPKTAYSKGTFLSYAKSFPDGFLVLETGTDIAGYIIFDRSGHIHSTAVKPTHRRKSFGTMLFKHAVSCTQKRLWLEVRSKNSSDIGFYHSLGMKIIERIPNYYRNDDALIMILDDKKYL